MLVRGSLQTDVSVRISPGKRHLNTQNQDGVGERSSFIGAMIIRHATEAKIVLRGCGDNPNVSSSPTLYGMAGLLAMVAVILSLHG